MLFQRDVSRNNIVVDGDYNTNNDYIIDDKASNGDIKNCDGNSGNDHKGYLNNRSCDPKSGMIVVIETILVILTLDEND